MSVQKRMPEINSDHALTCACARTHIPNVLVDISENFLRNMFRTWGSQTHQVVCGGGKFLHSISSSHFGGIVVSTTDSILKSIKMYICFSHE